MLLNNGVQKLCFDISGTNFDIDFLLLNSKFFYTNRTFKELNLSLDNRNAILPDISNDLFNVSFDIIDFLHKKLVNIFNIVIEKSVIRQSIYQKNTPAYSQEVALTKYHFMDLDNSDNCFSDSHICKTNILFNIKRRENFLTLSTKPSVCGQYIFSAYAMAQLINEIVSLFYLSNIYKGLSIFSINQLNKKKYRSSFNIISVPFEGIVFDSELEPCHMSYLIKEGKFVNILSNVLYSELSDCKSTGNADLIDRSNISHQRIIFDVKDYTDNSNIKCYVKFVNILSNLKGVIIVEAEILESKNIYRSIIELNIENIFNTIKGYSPNLEWNNNVLCPSCIITL